MITAYGYEDDETLHLLPFIELDVMRCSNEACECVTACQLRLGWLAWGLAITWEAGGDE